jgi:hypothetical protein
MRFNQPAHGQPRAPPNADLGLGLDLVYVAAKIVRDRLERSALLDELLEFVQIER